MSGSKLTIGVTGLQAGAYPAPGVEVARSLALAGLGKGGRLIGIDYDPLCTGLYLKSLFSSTHVLPSDNVDLLVHRIVSVFPSGGLNILVPCLDFDMRVLPKVADRLNENGIRTLLPPPQSLRWSDKQNLGMLLRQSEYRTPETQVLRSNTQLLRGAPEYTLPAVVKGNTCGAFPARTHDEIQVYAKKASRLFGWPILVQRLVTGAEYSIVGVADSQSRLRGCAAIKKFGITDDGHTWSATTMEPNTFVPLLELLIRRTEWVGPLEVDVVVEEDTGNICLVDFNPRFPSWIFVAAEAGANLPKLVVDMIRGKSKHESMLSANSGIVFSLTLSDVVQQVEEFMSLQANMGAEVSDVYRRV